VAAHTRRNIFLKDGEISSDTRQDATRAVVPMLVAAHAEPAKSTIS